MTGPDEPLDLADDDQLAKEAGWAAHIFELPSYVWPLAAGQIVLPCVYGCAHWYAAVETDTEPEPGGSGLVLREWHGWDCPLIESHMGDGWTPYGGGA